MIMVDLSLIVVIKALMSSDFSVLIKDLDLITRACS